MNIYQFRLLYPLTLCLECKVPAFAGLWVPL